MSTWHSLFWCLTSTVPVFSSWVAILSVSWIVRTKCLCTCLHDIAGVVQILLQLLSCCGVYPMKYAHVWFCCVVIMMSVYGEFMWCLYPYVSHTCIHKLHWHCGNVMIALTPVNSLWRIPRTLTGTNSDKTQQSKNHLYDSYINCKKHCVGYQIGNKSILHCIPAITSGWDLML